MLFKKISFCSKCDLFRLDSFYLTLNIVSFPCLLGKIELGLPYFLKKKGGHKKGATGFEIGGEATAHASIESWAKFHAEFFLCVWQKRIGFNPEARKKVHTNAVFVPRGGGWKLFYLRGLPGGIYWKIWLLLGS